MDATKNFVNDTFDRCGSVDCPSRSNGLLRLVQALYDSSFLLPSAPVAWVNANTLINPSHHSVNVVDLKNENTVKEVNEFRRIPTAPAEERYGLIMVRDPCIDFCHIPDGREVAFRDFICSWVGPEFPVAVYSLISPSLQFVADRGFTGAGNAVN